MSRSSRTILFGCLVVGICVPVVHGQSALRKPTRVEAPDFSKIDLGSVFFDDVRSTLQGPRPTRQESNLGGSNGTKATQSIASGSSPALSGSNRVAATASGWAELISPVTIEDTVKGSKLRLDQIVTTPAKFAGGGYAEARREFSLQALLFAIIEEYPTEVRWKNSSSAARQRFSRMAANAKVGSTQAYSEAKQRLQDLDDLLNGSQIASTAANEISWEQLIDRGPLMQLIEATFKEQIQSHSASPAAFAAHKEDLQRGAELLSAFTATVMKEGMPDAADEEYLASAKSMLENAKQIVLAVKTDNAEAARQAVGQIGQSCVKCHDAYR